MEAKGRDDDNDKMDGSEVMIIMINGW